MIIIILLAIPVTALADDSEDWSSYTKNFDKLQNQKSVTDEEFNKAIDTVKSMQKKKKSKKNKKDKNAISPEDIIDSSESINHNYMGSKSQLITVSRDFYYNTKLINAGFYTIKPLIDNENNYIMLIQGHDVIAKIKANKVTPDATDTNINKADFKMYNGYAKLIYSDIDNNLESTFYIKQAF